jgi:P27 family predicted phage terminase small subunit
MSGPKPLPANVHALRGNPSKKPLAALLDDVVRPEVAIPPAPAHLGADARAEWERITVHLQALGLIAEIDRAALTGYCVAWGRHVEAELRIAELDAEHQARLEAKAVAEAKAAAPKGRKAVDSAAAPAPRPLTASERAERPGHIGTTPSGYQQISVWLQISNRALEQCEKFLSHFGMSPALRARVTAGDPRQPELPGVEPKPQEGGWGAFK